MNKLILCSVLMFSTLVIATTKVFAQEQEEKVEQFVEQAPEFLGGDEARMKFLAENIIYPEKALNNNIQGTVYVTFVVEKDGSISHVKVLRGIGGGCDKEVIRVIYLMPKWTPGYLNGKAVRCQFNMPVKFTIQDDAPKQ